jgi:malate dehydrogenase (oxaloacetate-decarboxylating)(NADP+)
MKMAAVKALALLTKESVPEQVNIAYGATKLNFGRDYIIQNHLIKINYHCSAVAKAAMDSGVALNPITDWKNTKRIDGSSRNDNKMVRLITNRAKMDPRLFCGSRSLDVLKLPKLYGKRVSVFLFYWGINYFRIKRGNWF